MKVPPPLRNQPCPVDPRWLGSVAISPRGPLVVSSFTTLTIDHTVGRYGLDDRGAILLAFPTAADSSEPQQADPAAPGYFTVATDNPDVRLQVAFERDFWVRPLNRAILVRVRDGSLKAGDHIRITLGDTSAGSPGLRLQSFPERRHILTLLVDAFGTGEFYPLPEQQPIEIIPAAPAAIELILPSTPVVGTPVTGHVRVTDHRGNPVRTAVGHATISAPDGAAITGLPLELDLRDGITPFGPVTFTAPATVRLSVACGDLRGASNPVVIHAASADASPPDLFWADMHGQTLGTVGTGTVEEYFVFARDRALMDVAAWQGNDFQVTDELWRDVARQTRAFHEPGRFITFLGYEWSGLTPAGGDHNILYLHDDQPIHRSAHWQIHDGSDVSSDRYPLSELWHTFTGRSDVLAIAHVGGRYGNLDYHDGTYPQLVEVHSHHGTFDWIAEDAMRRGLTVGFVAQSDDHTGRPGLSGPLQAIGRGFATFDTTGGYTGVYAPELTREAVFRALQHRHCYATTGRRILLDVRAPGAIMGDRIQWPCGEPLPINLFVAAHGATILDLEVRCGVDVLHRHPWTADIDSPWIRVQWSGVRVRSRNKTTDWNGRIRSTGGEIVDFRPYAFDQPGQGASRVAPDELAVASSTSGDIDGVLIRLSSPDTMLDINLGPVQHSVRAGDVHDEPIVVPAGGVNQQLLLSRTAPEGHSTEVRASLSVSSAQPGHKAYWIKMTQSDGHMTWSSPIFVDFLADMP